MPTRPPSVKQYKLLLMNGLAHIRDNPKLFAALDHQRLDIQIDAVSKADTIEELGALATLPTPNHNLNYRPIVEMKTQSPEETTCMPFGQGTIGWYFMYGQMDHSHTHVMHNEALQGPKPKPKKSNHKHHFYTRNNPKIHSKRDKDLAAAFTIILFRVELASPTIVKKASNDEGKKTLKPENSVLWCVAGGTGFHQPVKPIKSRTKTKKRKKEQDTKQVSLEEQWFSLPYSMARGNYQCTSPTSFRFELWHKDTKHIKHFTLNSPRRGEFLLNLKYTTYKERTVSLKARLTSDVPPEYNGPGGCVPICFGGVGALYWSYTRMMTEARIKFPPFAREKTFHDGMGWFDHQWMADGFVDNTFVRMIRGLKRWSGSDYPKLPQWICLNLQFYEPKTQWMIIQPVNGPVTEDDVLEGAIVNLYDQQGTHYEVEKNLPVSIQVLKTDLVISETSGKAMFFPTQYAVQLGHGVENRYLMQADFGKSVMYLPNGNMNWEGSGSLWNADKTKRVGNCFFEANQLQSASEIITTTLKIAGFVDEQDEDPTNDWEIFRPV